MHRELLNDSEYAQWCNLTFIVRGERVHSLRAIVEVRCPELLTSVDAVEKAFEAFAPLRHLAGAEMPSLPSQPIKVIREVGEVLYHHNRSLF